jgi:hypothetical protein
MINSIDVSVMQRNRYSTQNNLRSTAEAESYDLPFNIRILSFLPCAFLPSLQLAHSFGRPFSQRHGDQSIGSPTAGASSFGGGLSGRWTSSSPGVQYTRLFLLCSQGGGTQGWRLDDSSGASEPGGSCPGSAPVKRKWITRSSIVVNFSAGNSIKWLL